MLSPSMAVLHRIARRWPHWVPTLPVTLAGLAARVLWHDSQVAAAVDAGIQQVVVIGAGYDTRAWRLRREGVQFFELDQAATQQDKVRRAPRPGPIFVPADLSVQSAADALRRHGLDTARPALFLLEGVTMYLTEDVVRRQLVGLGQTGAAGSRLTADFYPHREIGTAHDQRQFRMQRLARAGSGEGLRLLIDRCQAVKLVEASGWFATQTLGMRNAAFALVPEGSGLPLRAVNDEKTLVAAVRP